jgi:uncharacterized membrane protein
MRRRREAEASAAVTIRRPPEELYDFWASLTNLPVFMAYLESVTNTGGRRSRWRAGGVEGTAVEWEVEVVEDVPNRRIAWRAVEGAPNAGEVVFARAPRDRGTEVRVRMTYAPPGGMAGRIGAALLGEEPEQQLRDDLRRFKQLMETGEIVRSEASPEGLRTRRLLAQRPAQPLAA